jgi:hypothetical protein
MHKMMNVLLTLMVLALLPGCGEDAHEKSDAARRQAQLATQVEAERAARAEAERELARERDRRERERRDAQAGLKLAARKSTFSSVVAIVVASVATAAVVLVARERRIRSTLTAGLRHVLRRRADYDP